MNTPTDQQKHPDLTEAQIQLRTKIAAKILPELIRFNLSLVKIDPEKSISRFELTREALRYADMLIEQGRWLDTGREE